MDVKFMQLKAALLIAGIIANGQDFGNHALVHVFGR
jgi:hypothetical protein